MITVDRIATLRATLDAARRADRTVGFVPTMGALHAGHLSLVQAARAAHDVVVVSVFVNPLQFNNPADLKRYPRDLAADAALADAAAVDVLFAPSGAEMYPAGAPVTTVSVGQLTDRLCGASRLGHFDGVATVVAKLFAIASPCTAYFGKKDFQQLAVVTRLARDLNLPVEVVGCPLVREPDGLAMSSRNVHLDTAPRRAATILYRGLVTGAKAVMGGERDPAALRRLVANLITSDDAVRLEYAEVLDAVELTPLESLRGDVLVAVAAHVGATRLIDNVTIHIDDSGAVTADLGVIAGPESEAPCSAR